MRELVVQYGPLVWSLAKSFTRSNADAEDAAQEVFLHLWKKAGQYQAAYGTELQFVSVLTRRRLIDWLRAHSKLKSVDIRSFESQAESSIAGSCGADEEAEIAWEILSKLVVEQQNVLVLSIVHGLTHDQIAAHLQVPLGTVKTNLYRGLAALREEMENRRVSGTNKDALAPLSCQKGGRTQ